MTDAPPAAAKPYPLGVMFVHGIGEQPLGDTLKSVVDPIVRSLDLWIHGAARCRAVALGDAAANAWAEGMPGNDTTAREQAKQMAWSSEMSATKLTATQAEDIAASSFYAGSALLCDGRVQAASTGEAPPHAVLHVHTTDAHYKVTEGSALLAESWWAQSFVPPSSQALLSWTFKVLPMAIGMHLGDGVRRHGLRVAQGGGMASRAWHALLALLALAAMVVAVPLAMPLQALLVLTVILGMVPWRVVQDAMRTLQSVLVGTLGDSFLLVSSPVSRAMIVAQCKRDMHWMASQCEQVFVVAHSQGCAVSYLALCESLPSAVKEVTWIGSGLRKLEILRALERDSYAAICGWLVATMPFVAWALIGSMVKQLSWGSTPTQAVLALLAVLAYLASLVMLVLATRAGATGFRLSLWHGSKLRLTDIHASDDPVPHGPLFDKGDAQARLLKTREVRNQASRFGDHTGYWRNVEEVVLPLALRISAALGVPVTKLMARDKRLLTGGRRRRHHRVCMLVILRWLFLAGSAAALWTASTQWLALGNTLVDQGLAWVSPTGDFSIKVLAAALRERLPDLLLWIVAPYIVLMLAWRGWEGHEQRALLLRKFPNGLIEGLLTGLMVVATLLPAVRAARLNGIEAIVVLSTVAIFAAVFYVLMWRKTENAFD